MTEKDTQATVETVEIPAKFKDIVGAIEKMSVLDMSELVKVLEKKFGVSAQAPVAMMAGPAAAGAEAKAEEKTSFTVMIKESGAQKIQVIKLVKESTGKGLKEAKDIVDKVPAVVKENVPTKEAEELKKKLEEAGATVELK